MHPVFLFVAGYFVLGAIGTALACRGKAADVRRARWLKLFVYLLIVVGLIAVMLYALSWFGLLALAIIVGGAWELVKVARVKLQPRRLYNWTALIFGLSAAGFMRMAHSFDSQQLLYTFLVVFSFDGFCQIFGQLLGRLKLFPVISPNKTVEGLAGGALAGLLTAALTRDWAGLSLIAALWTGLWLCAAALAGDWLASFYKRRHGVKDFSGLIPGHGGVLDRFDSWLLAGAVAGMFF